MQLKTDCHQTAESFETLRQEWHQLLAQAASNEIFITPEYQSVWWRTLGEGALWLYTFRHPNGTLLGIAPLFETNSQLSFVGCQAVSDYLDFIVHSDYIEAVYQAITAELTRHQSNMFSFCSIASDSPTLRLLPKLMSKNIAITQQQQDVCPQITLPSSWDHYLTTLDRKQRHEIRRKWRKLAKETSHQFECLTEKQMIKKRLHQFIELHQLSSENKRAFWDADHQSFFEQLLPVLADQGWVKLFFLTIPHQARPIAAMLIFHYNNHYNLYNSGFDPQYGYLSPGQILTSYTIKHAIDQGVTLYDFLRGNEAYKFRLGGKAKPVYDLVSITEQQTAATE